MDKTRLIEEITAYLNSLHLDPIDPRIFESWSTDDLLRFAPARAPARPGFHFSCSVELLPKGCAVVRLGGTFDDLDSERFYRDIRCLLEVGHTTLILDCGRLEDVSKAAIAVMVHTIKLTSEAGGRLVLSDLSDRVDRKFTKLGFKPFLIIDERSPRRGKPRRRQGRAERFLTVEKPGS